MSISSCPECAGQVTLPVGVSNRARVRCPLCRAHYTLADALVNMPPLLEVVEDPGEDSASGWYDPAGRERGAQAAAPASAEPSREVEPLSEPDVQQAANLMSDSHNLSDGADFVPGDLDDDDLELQEKDTEIEDFSAVGSDRLEDDAPSPAHAGESRGPDLESVLDFDHATESKAETASGESLDEDITLDFDEFTDSNESPVPSNADNAEISFDLTDVDPASAPDGDDGIKFDFSEESPTAEREAALDLGAHDVSPSEPGMDDALDFGEPLATEPTAESSAAPPIEDTGKKGKKKKEKKPREPKAPANSDGKKRSHGLLIGGLVMLLLAIPLTLYGLVWLGPSYDFVGLSSLLPKAILPAKSRAKTVAKAPANPVPMTPDPSQTADESQPPDDTSPNSERNPSGAPSDGFRGAAQSESAAAETDTPPEPTEDSVAPPHPDTVADLPADSPTNPAAADSSEPETIARQSPDSPISIPNDSRATERDGIAADRTISDVPAAITFPTTRDVPAVPREAPHFDVADLSTAVRTAEAANRNIIALRATQDETQLLKKARSQFYQSLFGLAEVLTFATDDPSATLDSQRSQVERLVVELAADHERLYELKFYSAKWFNFPDRSTAGIMVSGTVHETLQLGKLYQIKLDIGLEGDGPIVTVLQGSAPSLRPGDSAFVVGSIIQHPDDQIPGYDDGETIVWSGMTLRISAR